MVLVKAPGQTKGKVRRPDAAYSSPDLIQQFGEDIATLLQSYPLVEEIFSPTDCGEDIFLKAQEYLSSDVLEVWLIFPKSNFYPDSGSPPLANRTRDCQKPGCIARI